MTDKARRCCECEDDHHGKAKPWRIQEFRQHRSRGRRFSVQPVYMSLIMNSNAVPGGFEGFRKAAIHEGMGIFKPGPPVYSFIQLSSPAHSESQIPKFCSQRI